MSPTKEPIQAYWRKLRSGAWGVECRDPRAAVGVAVEVSRRDGSRPARLRLSKLVVGRRGKLAPLFAVERLEDQA